MITQLLTLLIIVGFVPMAYANSLESVMKDNLYNSGLTYDETQQAYIMTEDEIITLLKDIAVDYVETDQYDPIIWIIFILFVIVTSVVLVWLLIKSSKDQKEFHQFCLLDTQEDRQVWLTDNPKNNNREEAAKIFRDKVKPQ